MQENTGCAAACLIRSVLVVYFQALGEQESVSAEPYSFFSQRFVVPTWRRNAYTLEIEILRKMNRKSSLDCY